MDAVKRATFHEQSLELHCTPDVDQALLEQLADVFGDIIRVERLPKLTCRGCTIIRIELEKKNVIQYTSTSISKAVYAKYTQKYPLQ